MLWKTRLLYATSALFALFSAVTALGKSVLHVIDMRHFPDNIKTVAVPDCKVGEDMAFSDDNKTWYLTCMGSDNVIVGDAGSDKPLKAITASSPGKAFIRQMNDGSITVIDLATNTAIASINTLKERGFNPNSIVLLP